MSLFTAQIKGMEVALWAKVKTAMTKRKETDPKMSMAKWITEAAKAKLRKEKG